MPKPCTCLTLEKLAEIAICTRLMDAQQKKVYLITDSKRFERWVEQNFPDLAHLPESMRNAIYSRITGGFDETHRWLDKHVTLFHTGNKRFRRRSEHLKLYLENAVWYSEKIGIDHAATAAAIVVETCDWPTLQFQFACAYALEEILICFENYQLRAFKNQLQGHPLYDFWFSLLLAPPSSQGVNMFEQRGLTPPPVLNGAFEWAAKYGFCEMCQFLWWRVAPWQQEYLGMLHWRPLCSKWLHPDVLNFLGSALHTINAQAVKRVTYQILMSKIHDAANADSQPIEGYSREKPEDYRKNIQKLLEYSFEPIQRYALRCEKRHAFLVALHNKDFRTFKLLLQFLRKEDRADLNKILIEKLEESKPDILKMAQRVMSMGMDPAYHG